MAPGGFYRMQPNSVAQDTVSPDELPDLTSELQPDKKRFVTQGAFCVVYQCRCMTKGEVAVKAVTFPLGISDSKKEKLKRSLRREFVIWRRLNHPNIVPLLGKACGLSFGFDHDCMISTWMPQGTLHMYIESHGKTLTASYRVRLIKDIASGLNYLHSEDIVHGDLHPGNALIDGDGNARLSDFGLSQVLLPVDDGLSYLRTMSVHPGAVMWAAPELLYPKLYPKWNTDGKPKASLNSDIYAFGNMVLFVLSEKTPWPDVPTAWKQLEKREIPQHREFSTISDDVWKFVKKCWSPKTPGLRPSSQEVLSYMSDTLENMSTLPPHDASTDPSTRRKTSRSSLRDYIVRLSSQFLPDALQVTQSCPVFRLLMIGNSGVGKSTLVDRVFGIDSAYTRGIADIDREFISPTNSRFVVHISPGSKATAEGNMEIVKQFVARRNMMPQLMDQVHVVWLCLGIPNRGGHLLDASVERLLRRRNEILGKTPFVVVFTKVDLLDTQWESDEPRNVTLEQYKSRYLNEYCIQPLREAAGDGVTYAIVSAKVRYTQTLVDLLVATDKKIAEEYSSP